MRATSTNAKLRRSHHKSRNGCNVCKIRHIKCDESRPSCINCSVVERNCVYPGRAQWSRSTRLNLPQEDITTSHTYVESSATANTPAVSTRGSPTPQGNVGAENISPIANNVYTMDHLILLHHVEKNLNDISKTSKTNEDFKHVLEAAFASPYLFNELLALSALHLSQGHPRSQEFHQQASDLQTRALLLFNEAREEVSKDHSVSMFIFASFLGLHTLYDTLQGQRDDFGSFLDNFTVYLDIHRGVSAVTTQSTEAISQSLIGPFISSIEWHSSEDENHAEETELLHDMIDQANLPEASDQAYRKTLTVLHECLSLQNQLLAEGLAAHEAPIRFCTAVNEEYITSLKQRQPEALVVLAYYAAMLHRSRDFWVFNDGGQYLIEAIISQLGACWEDRLAWPKSVLEES